MCSQVCRNTEGGFSCSCLTEYREDPDNRNSCTVARGKVGLLYAGQTDINLLDLSSTSSTTSSTTSTVLVSGVSASSLEFHWSEARIFWLDQTGRGLYSVSLHSPASPELVVADLAGGQDLALDWLHHTLLWTDSTRQTISLSSLGTFLANDFSRDFI